MPSQMPEELRARVRGDMSPALRERVHAAADRLAGCGILSLEPGTPEHDAAVAARGQTDAERDGL